MTYPSGSGTITNNYGPGTPNGATQGQSAPFTGTPSAGANVAQTNPSPGSWNSTNSETSTQELVSELIAAMDNQTPTANVYGTSDPPLPPGFNVAETTPSAPTGTFVQSGLPYISNAASVTLAGVSPMNFQYYTGGLNDAKG